MFSDRAGTTAVTTPGTVVGLRLDKSKGLALGAELVTNGTFDAGITDWTVTNANVGNTIGVLASGVLSMTRNVSGFDVMTVQSSNITGFAGKYIRLVCDYTETTSTNGRIQLYGSPFFNTIFDCVSGRNEFLFYVPVGTTSFFVTVRHDGGGTTPNTVTFDNISVRELPGNHAQAPTDAARPTYGIEPKGGRRNLLTWSEGFDNAVWAAAAVSIANPTKIAADEISFPAVVGADDLSIVRQSVTTLAVPYVASVELKAKAAGDVGKKVVIYINDGSTTGAYFHTLTSDYVRVSTTKTTAATTSYLSIGVFGTNRGGQIQGACNVNIRNAQLELGSTATAYQRVTTEFDVTEAGVQTCHYCRYDGNNNSMSTAAIDFTATDKMSVFAGVRKLSTADSRIVELSVDPTSNAGAFWLSGPQNTYEAFSRGTATIAANQLAIATGFVSPTINVVTSTHDIAGDLTTIRVNGAALASATGDKGTGNFGNYPMFIGRRNNATLPFNGKDYGIIIVGKAASAREITDTELWLSDKTAEVDVAKSISPNIYTRSGDTILDRFNSIIERRAL